LPEFIDLALRLNFDEQRDRLGEARVHGASIEKKQLLATQLNHRGGDRSIVIAEHGGIRRVGKNRRVVGDRFGQISVEPKERGDRRQGDPPGYLSRNTKRPRLVASMLLKSR
jgi:hypothetical protein